MCAGLLIYPVQDDAALPSKTSHSGRRSPKKQNRTNLDSTEEEGAASSRSRTPSPHPRPSPPHEVKVRQISRGVEDITWQKGQIPAEDDNVAILPQAMLADTVEVVTPIAASGTVPALDSTVEVDIDTEVSPDCTMKSSQKSSDSEGTNEEKRLKRKLADRAPSHGPETHKAAGLDDAKRTKAEDDNPRAKKRSSPPRTPEADSDLTRPTPPATPPAVADESFKAIEPLKRPREDADNDDNPRQTKKPSPPPEKIPEIQDTVMTTPKPVRSHISCPYIG